MVVILQQQEIRQAVVVIMAPVGSVLLWVNCNMESE